MSGELLDAIAWGVIAVLCLASIGLAAWGFLDA